MRGRAIALVFSFVLSLALALFAFSLSLSRTREMMLFIGTQFCNLHTNAGLLGLCNLGKRVQQSGGNIVWMVYFVCDLYF